MTEKDNNSLRLTNFIRMCGELACLLEVSATPKPGNVHRFRDFYDVRYEDFLASSVSFGYWIEELALKGSQIRTDPTKWSELHLGLTIKKAVEQSNFFHGRGNTNLGIILLLAPLSVAAGMTFDSKFSNCNSVDLNLAVIDVMKNTTVEDAIAVSEAIALANPGGLGEAARYNVKSDSFRDELIQDNITLELLMLNCKSRDNICFELSQSYMITFHTGLPILQRTISQCNDINIATINTYLAILASFPDTLVQRKLGKELANNISDRAKTINSLGGALTVEGRRELEEFDIELREETEKINPGTTADLVASTLFAYLLSGGKLWPLEQK
ncbi:MAG: ATP--dephospho-CoA triphosphoribosyl transferase CitG [Asgard group archaeon]|nr:ATP--dephospho-CoA triphosphoribosyl transferase CitG [Asgard group archaeon]